MDSDRIEALEIALTHAEAAVADLSDACREQWREIDLLRKEIGKLTRTMEAFARAASEEKGAPDPNQRPPHY